MNFVEIKDLNVTASFDVLYCDKNWSIKRGFLYNTKGVTKVLVDDEVFEDGEVILLSAYTTEANKSRLKLFGLL